MRLNVLHCALASMQKEEAASGEGIRCDPALASARASRPGLRRARRCQG